MPSLITVSSGNLRAFTSSSLARAAAKAVSSSSVNHAIVGDDPLLLLDEPVSNARAGAASKIAPARDFSRVAIAGAAIAPSEWPRTNTRFLFDLGGLF